MEERHYTPKLEDLRVGYSYDLCVGTTINEEGDLIQEWQYSTIHEEDNFQALKRWIQEGHIRTRYLITEDITSLGWEDEGQIVPQEEVTSDKPINLRKFNKGKYIMIYDFVGRVVMIAISIGDIFSVCVQRFDCPSINELSYILSSLNLNSI